MLKIDEGIRASVPLATDPGVQTGEKIGSGLERAGPIGDLPSDGQENSGEHDL